ncbi:MAG: molybdenum cofactor biosynthesis protein MoaE [Actinomycetota bacterium]|nr:molybdenum cofactor biosynthesis protein MoaE [Actinomycetota bacterium]
MRIAELLQSIKKHPDFERVGMILCHNGVVRGFSRDGRKVSGVNAEVDRERLDALIAEMKARPGIVEILTQVNEGKLSVGEDIMYVCVAGDIRSNVFPVLEETVNRIKKEVLKKEEEVLG